MLLLLLLLPLLLLLRKGSDGRAGRGIVMNNEVRDVYTGS